MHIASAQLILCTTVAAIKNMTLDFEEKTKNKQEYLMIQAV